MYRAGFLLHKPIRAYLASVKPHRSHSQLPRLGAIHGSTYRPLKTWMGALKLEVPSSYWNIIVRRYHYHIHNLHIRGGKYAITSIFGFSAIVGSVGLWPRIAYSTDGFEFLADDDQLGMLNDLQSKEDRHAVLTFVRKLVVPVFLFITVLMNWGHPIIIAFKVTLILFSTKPSPLSIYLLVEQLRNRAMQQLPLIYKFKPIYVKKVDVEDYIFLCLARVELKDQRFTLLGILGSWWILPQSSWQEGFFMLRNRA